VRPGRAHHSDRRLNLSMTTDPNYFSDSAVPALTLAGVSKSFPGVRALRDMQLTLRAGETTALIGENGAGKSTLVKILTGLYSLDSGTVEVAGRPVSFRGPRDAWAAGIVAIHQETVMFDELSVAENIFMGHAPRGRFGGVDWGAMRDRARSLLDALNSELDPLTPVKRLGVAQKHIVEIARALSHDAKVVIMDEPTAALSAHEIEELFAIVERLKRDGRAILFISHKFDEIFRIADRWTCLRDGEHVGEGLITGTTERELVSLMVGRSIDRVFPKTNATLGETVLEVADLSNASEFDGVSLTLRRGEILGLYGLVGAGRSEAMQCLFGLTPRARGEVRIDGVATTFASPAAAVAAGIAYVPEDRQMQGAVLPFGVRANMTLASLPRYTSHGVLSKNSELAETRRLGERLSVKAANWEQTLAELSGGNQQKVVIGKWLATRPRILILDEPTKGIDIGSKAAVHEFMGELAREGLAIILVSSELPEVLGMSDTVLVMREGRVVGRFAREDATPEAIVRAASGLAQDKAA
jgi:rhamnose transport system ATP-binding protein